MQTLAENHTLLSLGVNLSIGIVSFPRFPFPDEHPLLELMLMHEPSAFWAIRYAYVAMQFSMPLIGISKLFSVSLYLCPKTTFAANRELLRRYVGRIRYDQRSDRIGPRHDGRPMVGSNTDVRRRPGVTLQIR